MLYPKLDSARPPLRDGCHAAAALPPGVECKPERPPRPVFVRVAGRVGFVPRHPDDVAGKKPLNLTNGIVVAGATRGAPPELLAWNSPQKLKFLASRSYSQRIRARYFAPCNAGQRTADSRSTIRADAQKYVDGGESTFMADCLQLQKTAIHDAHCRGRRPEITRDSGGWPVLARRRAQRFLFLFQRNPSSQPQQHRYSQSRRFRCFRISLQRFGLPLRFVIPLVRRRRGKTALAPPQALRVPAPQAARAVLVLTERGE